MLLNNNEYLNVLQEIKQKIYAARYRVVDNANAEMIMLYWNLGREINARKAWGSKFIDSLSKDLRLEFPSATGYSVRN